MKKLLLVFALLTAACTKPTEDPSWRVEGNKFFTVFVPCNHGCQTAPFYRGSSRYMRFYPAKPSEARSSFALILGQANKEGGTVVFATSGTVIDGGEYPLDPAIVLVPADVIDITIMNARMYIGASRPRVCDAR